jgi:site-specific DNA recombinase
MTNVVAYYRMSTDRQEASIPAQRTEVQAYAAKHGHKIIREYLDEGISGDATEKRSGFQKMIRDARESRDFRAILCWDQDRFGRFDPIEGGYWIKPLRDAGIHLETVAQGKIDWDDFTGRLVWTVNQEAKHGQSVDLSRNVLRGMQVKAKHGLWLGGRAPYAYRVEGQRLFLGDPEHVQIVREIFDRYANTQISIRALAHKLTSRGIAGPSGAKWYPSVLRKILTNPLYMGDMTWNRLHMGKYHGIEGRNIKSEKPSKDGYFNPKSDWIDTPNAHEPIVDRKTWEAVQRKLVERRKLTYRHGSNSLMTGLVFCGHCGGPMHGRTDINEQGRRYRRLICSRYNDLGRDACQGNRTSEQALVEVVIKKIVEDFLDPRNLTKLRAEVRRQLRERNQPQPAAAKKLRSKLTALGKQIDKGAERLLTAPADLTETLAGKLRGWQQERERLRAELAGLENAPSVQSSGADLGAKAEAAIDQLHGLRERIKTANPEHVREVLRQTVSRVECWFEHVPYGKKGKQQSILTRGLIHLRPDIAVYRPVLSGGPINRPTKETI